MPISSHVRPLLAGSCPLRKRPALTPQWTPSFVRRLQSAPRVSRSPNSRSYISFTCESERPGMASRRKSSCSSVYLRLAMPLTPSTLRTWWLLPHAFIADGVTGSPNSAANASASSRLSVTGYHISSHAFCSGVYA